MKSPKDVCVQKAFEEWIRSKNRGLDRMIAFKNRVCFVGKSRSKTCTFKREIVFEN